MKQKCVPVIYDIPVSSDEYHVMPYYAVNRCTLCDMHSV